MRGLACFLSMMAILLTGTSSPTAEVATGSGSSQVGHVLVSIAPQKYFVERIAGNALKVTVLVKPGADPHSYEPSPAQMMAASGARLYFTAGIDLERAWIPRIGQVAKKLRVVELGGQSDPRDLAVKDGGEQAPDYLDHDDHDHALHMEAGHTWLSPAHVRAMLPLLTEALCVEFPSQATMLRANAVKFEQEIEMLDVQIRRLLKNIPEERRQFMTFHPAWKNFAEDYDLREIAIETDGKEPGPRRMAELIRYARDKGIKIILIEPQFSRKTAESIAQSVSAALVDADPLAENWEASLLNVAKSLAGAL